MDLFNDLVLPPAKTAVAEQTDTLFWFVHISSAVVSVGILIVMAYFVYKYRRKSEDETTPYITHNNKLEVTWSVVPLIIVLIIFGWGYKIFLDQQIVPDEAYEVQVTGQMWMWQFTYENGARSSGELHVPADRPVKLVMTSQDVIHSFFIPDYRIKKDVLPGRYTELWFNVPEPGESPIYCTEYCGTGHSDMLATVIVHEQDEFEDWLAENAGGGAIPEDMAPAEWGKQLVDEWACTTCHSTDGSQMTGPTWQGIFDSETHLTDGSTITVDENYLRESMLEPGAKVVEGFPNVMNTYQGQLNDEQINAIIEYLKTL